MGRNRYGIVLLLAIVAVVFLIVAPAGALSRALGLLIVSAMLLVVVATSRGDLTLRKTAVAAIGVVTLLVAVLAALSDVPSWVSSAVAIVVVGVTLGQLVRGLMRMLRTQGVTVQAVAGALAVYLLLGIMFAFAVGFAARVGSGDYFAQGIDGTESQHVYFSFTSMTTTGYGDLTPATRAGRAIAVLEMLIGQIYLVTIISLLVGNLRRRDEPGPAA
ncbi:MAG TPA: potassium channel family protein [Conexibacter sp.]|nr:potassium channel family protein [Conexibacter sp.]